MSSSARVLGACCVVSVSALIGLSYNTLRLQAELRQARAELAAERVQFSRLAATTSQPSASSAAISTSSPAEPEVPAAVEAEKPAGSAAGYPAYFTAFSSLPDKRPVRLVFHRYGFLLKQFNLSSEQTQRVADLLAARDLAEMDARAAARKTKLPLGELDRAITAATKEYDAQLRGVLGESNYRQFQDFIPVQMTRSSLGATVGVDFELAGEPLADDQLTRLAQIWVEKQDPVRNPRPFGAMPSVIGPSGLAPSQQAILQEAAKVLTRKQLTVLQSYIKEQTKGPVAALIKD